MNYPVWALPAPGLLIAAVGIVHVFVSHFAVGGGLFLVLAERRARAGSDAALLAFVRALRRGFVLLTLVLGALTGVGIWFAIALVQPQATSALVTTFVWPGRSSGRSSRSRSRRRSSTTTAGTGSTHRRTSAWAGSTSSRHSPAWS